MQSIEIHQLSCGECIVLRGANKDILMVDCGETAQGGVPDIMKRYSGAAFRSFLLTHYHNDELRALERIVKINPNYLDRIYLPFLPCDRRGRPLLLEFALFAHVFSRSRDDSYNEDTAVLRIFHDLAEKIGAGRMMVLKADSNFRFDGVDYDVLWPAAERFPFSDLFAAAVEDMNVCLSSPFLPEAAKDFLRLKDQFCTAYLACCRTSPMEQTNISSMAAIYNNIEEMIPQLSGLPSAPDIAEILGRPTTRTAYAAECRAASVIFHNRRKREASTDDVLMTGAAEPESMDAVSGRLYDGYFILKAPQHGAPLAWSHVFGEISASHILISHGNNREYESIAAEYIDLPAIRHCTDSSGCPWFQSSGCSCNRMSCCYDLPRPGLAIKCPCCQDAKNDAPCGIYVITSSGTRSCLCDGKPVNIN
nr:hypothetical protein [uncultured Caproiciproducens sp.]